MFQKYAYVTVEMEWPAQDFLVALNEWGNQGYRVISSYWYQHEKSSSLKDFILGFILGLEKFRFEPRPVFVAILEFKGCKK